MKDNVLISETDKMTVANIYGKKFEVEMNGAYPIAIFHEDKIREMYCYPIFDGHAHNNLYGRLMTIIEAVIEDKDRQKAVKDIISKELGSFSQELKRSATEIATGGGSTSNIYNK